MKTRTHAGKPRSSARGVLGRIARSLAPRIGGMLPPSARYWMQLLGGGPTTGGGLYEIVYERHGAAAAPEWSIGDGDFELIGALELAILANEGLRPEHTVVDFGCGTGRLAVHLIPALGRGGAYVGIDIADSMLEQARRLVARRIPAPACDVKWVKQRSPRFLLADGSVDMMCAFSVFTHMEHEDAFNYLSDARRVVRGSGKFVFSCLPMNLPVSREVFLGQARLDLGRRWASVRSVATTVDMMETIARMAGWEVAHWCRGDEANIDVPGRGKYALGQSTCVLVRPA